jgi:hypothetical protein
MEKNRPITIAVNDTQTAWLRKIRPNIEIRNTGTLPRKREMRDPGLTDPRTYMTEKRYAAMGYSDLLVYGNAARYDLEHRALYMSFEELDSLVLLRDRITCQMLNLGASLESVLAACQCQDGTEARLVQRRLGEDPLFAARYRVAAAMRSQLDEAFDTFPSWGTTGDAEMTRTPEESVSSLLGVVVQRNELADARDGRQAHTVALFGWVPACKQTQILVDRPSDTSEKADPLQGKGIREFLEEIEDYPWTPWEVDTNIVFARQDLREVEGSGDGIRSWLSTSKG